jgi:hypothetical protein
MVRADLHVGVDSLLREQELFFCRNDKCLLEFCISEQKQYCWSWKLEWKVQAALSRKDNKCSDQCEIPENFRCDFCGISSDQHKHYTIPTTSIRYITLIPAVEDFYVCSTLCGERMCACLTKCDLSHGIPYMVKSAYHPRVFGVHMVGNVSCWQCDKYREIANMERADIHCTARYSRFFCKNKKCFLKYVQYHQSGGGGFTIPWLVQELGKVGEGYGFSLWIPHG